MKIDETEHALRDYRTGATGAAFEATGTTDTGALAACRGLEPNPGAR